MPATKPQYATVFSALDDLRQAANSVLLPLSSDEIKVQPVLNNLARASARAGRLIKRLCDSAIQNQTPKRE